MKTYDFGISCVYSKDYEFVKILKLQLKEKKKTFYDVNYDNFDKVIEEINKNEISFKVFVDLSSFEHPAFSFLTEKLDSKGTIVINNPQSITNTLSKSKLYFLLKKNNLPLRKTFVLKPKEKNDKKFKQIIKTLKIPFVINPSSTFYENDIVLNGNKPSDISEFIDSHETEDILVQEYIVPKITNKKVAWIRIIYSCGKILHHWWDPQTHFYEIFGNSNEENKIKNETKKYIEKISDLTKLKIFSTEIVLKQDGKYVIIDYANNPIDLSSQEFEKDGLPKKTLIEIAKSVLEL